MSVRVLFKWVEVEESGFVGDGVLAILPLSAKNLAHDTSEAETPLQHFCQRSKDRVKDLSRVA